MVNEYECPNCGEMKTMWPTWNGKKRYYKCEKCGKEYSSSQLDKAWGRTKKKQPSQLSVLKM